MNDEQLRTLANVQGFFSYTEESSFWSCGGSRRPIECYGALGALFPRRRIDLTGIATGRAQAQHALSAMLGNAESAPDRRRLPDARKKQD